MLLELINGITDKIYFHCGTSEENQGSPENFMILAKVYGGTTGRPHQKVWGSRSADLRSVGPEDLRGIYEGNSGTILDHGI
jgi:hypothetical protein